MVLFRTSYPTDFSGNVHCVKLSVHTSLQKNALNLHVFPLKPHQAMGIRAILKYFLCLFAVTILLFSFCILLAFPFA